MKGRSSLNADVRSLVIRVQTVGLQLRSSDACAAQLLLLELSHAGSEIAAVLLIAVQRSESLHYIFL